MFGVKAALLCVTLCLVGVSCQEYAISGKFVNLTNRKMKLYWVNHEDEPYLNAIVMSGQSTSFATYPGHRFFWGEYTGAEGFPTKATGAEGVNLVVEEKKTVYSLLDASSDPKVVDAYRQEQNFNAEYLARTGRGWIGEYPRHPPIYKQPDPVAVGHTREVTFDEKAARYLCADVNDPKCRSSNRTMTIRTVAKQPRVFVIEDFLTDYECETVIEYHRPRMTRSTTGHGENARVEKVRTSMSDRMDRSSYTVADALYRRVAAAVDIPQELVDNHQMAESINIVAYKQGQEYTPHYDVGADGTHSSRFISALLYFNEPAQGGATSFPKSPNEDGTLGIRVPPKKRQLVFFYDLLPDGNFDDYSLHAGEPVEEGEKWIGAAWLWDPFLSNRMPTDEEKAKYRTSFYPSLFNADGSPKPQAQFLKELEAANLNEHEEL